MSNPLDADQIRAASKRAFELAIRYRAGDRAAGSEVPAIRAQLDALEPAIAAAVGHDAEGLHIAWSEALLDLDWVESGGILPTSIRFGLESGT